MICGDKSTSCYRVGAPPRPSFWLVTTTKLGITSWGRRTKNNQLTICQQSMMSMVVIQWLLTMVCSRWLRTVPPSGQCWYRQHFVKVSGASSWSPLVGSAVSPWTRIDIARFLTSIVFQYDDQPLSDHQLIIKHQSTIDEPVHQYRGTIRAPPKGINHVWRFITS